MSSFSFAVAYWLGLLIRSDSHSTSVAVLVLSSTSLIRDHRSNWLLHYFGMESNFETKGVGGECWWRRESGLGAIAPHHESTELC